MKKKGRIISLNHTAFRVKDVHESFKFYHDILGLPTENFEPKEYSRVTFQKGLELMSPRLQDKLPEGFEFAHLGFLVENIEAVVEELESKGIKFILMDNKDKIREIKWKETNASVKIAFFQDPNGIRCELVEWIKP